MSNRHTLIEEELLEAFRMEPDLMVTFRAAAPPVQRRTPQTDNWQLALMQKAELTRVASSRKGLTDARTWSSILIPSSVGARIPDP